mmetsp:Transcript_11388/g.18315  ORF Transcript_11388/g.18315 Transcript_11388/m.18315 type:complete len:274 (-) Transcript_11388:260-1081(-)
MVKGSSLQFKSFTITCHCLVKLSLFEQFIPFGIQCCCRSGITFCLSTKHSCLGRCRGSSSCGITGIHSGTNRDMSVHCHRFKSSRLAAVHSATVVAQILLLVLPSSSFHGLSFPSFQLRRRLAAREIWRLVCCWGNLFGFRRKSFMERQLLYHWLGGNVDFRKPALGASFDRRWAGLSRYRGRRERQGSFVDGSFVRTGCGIRSFVEMLMLIVLLGIRVCSFPQSLEKIFSRMMIGSRCMSPTFFVVIMFRRRISYLSGGRPRRRMGGSRQCW